MSALDVRRVGDQNRICLRVRGAFPRLILRFATRAAAGLRRMFLLADLERLRHFR